MGLDFVRKAAKPFNKGLDHSLVKLATPGLFTVQPDCKPRAYAATIRSGKALSRGEELNIRLSDGKVIAQKGIDTVAEIDSPPRDLMEALVCRTAWPKARCRRSTRRGYGGDCRMAEWFGGKRPDEAAPQSPARERSYGMTAGTASCRSDASDARTGTPAAACRSSAPYTIAWTFAARIPGNAIRSVHTGGIRAAREGSSGVSIGQRAPRGSPAGARPAAGRPYSL